LGSAPEPEPSPADVLVFEQMRTPRWLADTIVRAAEATNVDPAYLMALTPLALPSQPISMEENMRNALFLALLGSSALYASAALAQGTGSQPTTTQPARAGQQATLADCDRLVTVLEQRKPANAGVTVEQVRTYKSQNNAQACRDALVRIDPASANQTAEGQAGDASRIVVQQPAPAIRVEQASPQVAVQQPQPNVTVHQPQPEILVRQPPPTIRVEMPQPEITVRMPQPDVNVAMAQPQVRVNQPQPQVQVVQPQSQPQVQVQRDQAKVEVQQAQGQPNVQVQQAQPTVRYERTGEPQVIYKPAEGQPQVRVEQVDQNRQGQQANQQSRQAAQSTGSVGNVAAQPLTVSRIKSMKLYSTQNEDLGDVERVVQGADGKPYLIIGSGGFLGLGEKQVAIPAERVSARGDRLVVQGITNDQIKAMPTVDRNDRSYRDMDGNATVPLAAAS